MSTPPSAELTTSANDSGWPTPTLSPAERDRRWGALRVLMRRETIDCVIAGASTGNHGRDQADVKYLTQLGNNNERFGVVFPLDTEPVVVAWRSERRPGDDWIKNIRGLDGFAVPGLWGQAFAAILRERGLERATIAVSGLEPDILAGVREFDGFFPHLTMRALQRALPNATFVSASPLMGRARYVKGPEEIEFLRKGVGLAERALYAMAQNARSGAFEPAIYGAMLNAQIAAGGSLPIMLGWTSGPFGQANARLEQPVHRHLTDGDQIGLSIEGRWAGYSGQLDVSAVIGSVPQIAVEAHSLAVEVVTGTIAALRPGVTFGELSRRFAERKPPPGYKVLRIIHGRGLGDDGPLFHAGEPSEATYGVTVEANTAFAVKVVVSHGDMKNVARIGDSIVITANGAERLGTWPRDHYWRFD